MSDLKEFTVYRDLWLRGKGVDESGLLTPGGMCCLGFACHAAGVPMGQLLGRSLPVNLGEEDPGIISHIPARQIAKRNDRRGDNAEREADLCRLFAAQGITVHFEDKAPEELRRAYLEVLGG